MLEPFPNLGTQTLLFGTVIPALNYPLVELFSAVHKTRGTVYFIGMFTVEGLGVTSPCEDENEARATYKLWTRKHELPEDVFTAEGVS